ncbi:MAG: FtsW/RodA/SpoVE family cell cycle protein [Cyanobacteria bacterium J06628_4]
MQSLINIGVATGSLPTTGLPFPMMSYGGSSMMSSLVIAGLLIRVAREAHEADIVAMTEQPLRPRRYRPGSRRRRHVQQPQPVAPTAAVVGSSAPTKKYDRPAKKHIRLPVRLRPDGIPQAAVPKPSRKRKRKRIRSI